MDFLKRFKTLPSKTRKLMSLSIILGLTIALPLFVWALVNLNFNLKEKAATGEPPVNHPAYWSTNDAIISADDFYVIIAGEYYFADNSSVTANSTYIDANTLQTDIVTQENNRNTSLRILFKKGNGQWWAESIEGRVDSNQFAIYNGPFINYAIGSPYTLRGEHYFEFTDPYNSSEKGIIYVTDLFVNAFTSVIPLPSTPGISQCSQSCQSNNDCASGLSCWIPNNQTSGVCKNTQCMNDSDCTCTIPKTITCDQQFSDTFSDGDQFGAPNSNIWETIVPSNVYIRNDTKELIISGNANADASYALRSIDSIKDGEDFQIEVDINQFLTELANNNDLATAELKAYNNDSNYFTIRWTKWMDNNTQHSQVNLWATTANQTVQGQGVDIPSGSTPKLKLVRTNGQEMRGFYDLGLGYIELPKMSGVYAGTVKPTLFAYKRGFGSSYIAYDNFRFGCVTPDPIYNIGDINGDGKVNIVDIGIIIENYGSTEPNLNGADVSGDGKVNIVDIGIIIDNYVY